MKRRSLRDIDLDTVTEVALEVGDELLRAFRIKFDPLMVWMQHVAIEAPQRLGWRPSFQTNDIAMNGEDDGLAMAHPFVERWFLEWCRMIEGPGDIDVVRRAMNGPLTSEWQQ